MASYKGEDGLKWTMPLPINRYENRDYENQEVFLETTYQLDKREPDKQKCLHLYDNLFSLINYVRSTTRFQSSTSTKNTSNNT